MTRRVPILSTGLALVFVAAMALTGCEEPRGPGEPAPGAPAGEPPAGRPEAGVGPTTTTVPGARPGEPGGTP